MQQVMGDLFSAGMETIKSSLQWAVLFMLHHPELMKAVQEELDQVVGRKRLPKLEDLPYLPVTESTILEVLRRSSIVPMGTTHAPTRLVLLHFLSNFPLCNLLVMLPKNLKTFLPVWFERVGFNWLSACSIGNVCPLTGGGSSIFVMQFFAGGLSLKIGSDLRKSESPVCLKSSLCRPASSLTPGPCDFSRLFPNRARRTVVHAKCVCVYVTAPLVLSQEPQIERFPPSRKRPGGTAPPRRPHGPKSLGGTRKVQPLTLHQFRGEGHQTGILPPIRRWAEDVPGRGVSQDGALPLLLLAAALLRH